MQKQASFPIGSFPEQVEEENREEPANPGSPGK